MATWHLYRRAKPSHPFVIKAFLFLFKAPSVSNALWEETDSFDYIKCKADTPVECITT